MTDPRREAEDALRRAEDAVRDASERKKESSRIAKFLTGQRVNNHFAKRFMDFRERHAL